MNSLEDNYKNRDILLGEIHKGVKDIEQWCKDHDKKDDDKFKEINKKIVFLAIAILLIASATGIVPQVLAFMK